MMTPTSIVPIGPHVTGSFSLLALYPFDTRLSFKIPERHRRDEPPSAAMETLQGILSKIVQIRPPGSRLGPVPLTFNADDLGRIFADSPTATWSTVRCALPTDWFLPHVAGPTLPAEVQFEEATAALRLFDGGMGVIAVEAAYSLRPGLGPSVAFPAVVKRTLDGTFRYQRDELIQSCATLAAEFSACLGTGRGELAGFLPRLRTTSAREIYPTIITKIWWNDPPQPSRFTVGESDLTEAMYLDSSELSNALPSFEDDFIAVGYDSVWWLLSPLLQERTEHFRERVELTFQYALSLSMLIYVLHQQIDAELTEIRQTISRGEVLSEEALRRTGALRSEVEDLLKELSLELFSTWVSDIRLFGRIMKNWLMDVSRTALTAKIEAVNVILREAHQERLEHEQGQMTQLGTIFAAAGVASVLVATLTLLFTQTHWEQQPTVALVLFLTKIALAAFLITLPTLLVLPLRNRWKLTRLRKMFGHAEEGRSHRA